MKRNTQNYPPDPHAPTHSAPSCYDVRKLCFHEFPPKKRSENFTAKKIEKNVKISDFEFLIQRCHFFPKFTFFTYSHKLQNLSFNLAPIFFLCSQGLFRYRENKCVQDFW